MGRSANSKKQLSTMTTLGTRAMVSLVAIASFALSACSSNSSSTSQVSLTMPDWSSFTRARAQDTASSTTYTLSRLMINVTGGALPAPKIMIWDASQTNTTAAPPLNFNFTVAKGGTGLVQVLAILSPSTASSTGSNSGSLMLYAGKAQAFDSDNVAVDVSLNLISQTAGSANGLIAGRYLRGDGATGPTGFVDIKYVPDDGTPPMIVTTSEIHGGWFEFTAFESLNFTYTLRGVNDLISNFNLDSTSLLSGKQNMMVSIPASYQNNNGTYVAQNPTKLQLGYYGPGVTVQSICYDSLASDSIPGIYSDAAGDAMPWSGTALPTAAQAGVTAGGQPASRANCLLPATQNITWLRFDQTILQSGANRSLGFHGPFAVLTDGNLLDVAAPDASHMNLSFTLMPGTVGTGRVTGVGVFTRDLASVPTSNGNKDYQIDDGIACNRLTDSSFLSQTFTLQSRVPVSAAGAQSISVAGVPSADFAAGKLQVILCPYSDIQPLYYNLAADAGGNGAGSSGGSTNGDMSITSPTGSLTQLTSVCTPYQINNVMKGVLTPATTAQSFTLSVSSASAMISTNALCTGGVTSLYGVIAAGSSSTTVYMKDATQQFDYLNLLVNASGYGRTLQVAVAALNSSGVITQTMPMAANSNIYNLATGLCYPVDISVQYGSVPIVPVTPVTYNLSLGDSSSGLYTDSSCSSSLSPATIVFNSVTAYRRIYLKSTTPAANSAIQALQSGNVSGFSTGGSLPFVMANGSAAALTPILFNSSGSTIPIIYYPLNTCQQVQLSYVASNGAASSAPANQALTLSSATSGVNFFTNASCTGSGASSIATTISASTNPNAVSSQPIFVNFGNAMTSTLTFGPSGASLGSATFYAQPDSISMVSVQPSYTTYVQNQCSPMTLAAVRSGANMTLPIASTINISALGGNFYSDPYCKVYISSMSFAANQAVLGNLYMLNNNSAMLPTLSLLGSNLTSSVTSFAAAAFTLTPTLVTAGTSTAPSMLSANSCYQYMLNYPTTATTVTVTLKDTTSLTPLNGNYFYTNSTCTSSLSGTSYTATSFTNGLSASVPNSMWYIKTGSTAPVSIPISVLDTVSGYSFNFESTYNP